MHFNIIISDLISWQICLFLLLLLLFIIWLFYGGEEKEYIGYSPLLEGNNKDAKENRNIEEKEKEETEGDGENEDKISDEEFSEISTLDSQDIENSNHVLDTSQILDISNGNSKKNVNFAINNKYSKELKISYSYDDESKNKALGNNKCRINKNLSKGEQLCRQVIQDIYGVPFYCVRPIFLKNPETGRNLELDLYNDDLKLAIEYNGQSHYVFPNNFHKTEEEFINQVRRDQFKLEMCDKNGIYLITVPYHIPLEYESIKNYILQHLKT